MDIDDWCSFFFFICSIDSGEGKLKANLKSPPGK
jgi:hypothetical protein